jgi:predicted dienelactone hydrolase
MEVAPDHVDIGDDAMHEYLIGRRGRSGQPQFIADILQYPDAVWVTDVAVPDAEDLYGPASGITLPAVTFIAYPSSEQSPPRTYSFPYHDAAYGSFEDMLAPGEEPSFAKPNERYPLIILSHGSNAHGIYDVAHAQELASHGYIVAVITYGDERTTKADDPNIHVGYLRPLITKAVLDSLLDSDRFGPHIDANNIGISGFSFGGFTALALAGGAIEGNSRSVSDRRITAAVVAAPWVGGVYDDDDYFAFGPNSTGLNRIDIPVIGLFGTNDEVSHSSFILPAMKALAGPAYVIELIDQTHALEKGSWGDRNNWELLFFSAFLKHDPTALEALNTTRSMNGGNGDVQRFDYQVRERNL